MVKYKFELRKDKSSKDGLAPIRVLIRIDGSIIKRNTGCSCRVEDWLGTRVKQNSKKDKYYGYDEINEKLKDIEEKIENISLKFRANKIGLTKVSFLEKFDNPEIIEAKGGEFNFFECFDEYLKNGKLTKAENTIKAQTTVKNLLKTYSEEQGVEISFSKIDNAFFRDLVSYLNEVKKVRQNYFAKIIKILKSFLSWATIQEYNTKRDYEKFVAAEIDIDIIYLTYEELMKLKNHRFKEEKLQKICDVFLFGCFTGLRYSDLQKLHLANISDNHIILSIQKTRTQNHAIKLNKFAKEILLKYKGTINDPLPIISSQKFNKYIKEACEEAEIDTPFTIQYFEGNVKKSLTQPKHRFLSSHHARKTFITNSLLLGMEPKAIKKIVNIKKDSVLDKYLKITEAFTDDQMDKAWNK